MNIASLAGQNDGTATGAYYAASKARSCRPRDQRQRGCPGPLELPSVRALVPADKLEQLVANNPAGTLGDPAWIADIVLRLAAHDAGYITGTTWDANGGLNLR